mmetsp:Transcript_12533/g.30280  ORF Transcript_12533/g.30280 Transcript_12533/m.30280 type:complete len:227 (-) Transcript_12533:333-1013(-)|eukprot:CAMPEP_0113468358 /NCGR_PEP_ID=MMETSP0014_2-20120614/15313_1 /TAXON_ID=2857 /ORGANISM="Nitzschia sp." /LENGTH=226 /DNA_ID=CAMNT_0000360743 /DNA_START=114 /DNA_END=794 /DNA_ORIENTATION=- /assembly_acc=CAM_ASM_000159
MAEADDNNGKTSSTGVRGDTTFQKGSVKDSTVLVGDNAVANVENGGIGVSHVEKGAFGVVNVDSGGTAVSNVEKGGIGAVNVEHGGPVVNVAKGAAGVVVHNHVQHVHNHYHLPANDRPPQLGPKDIIICRYCEQKMFQLNYMAPEHTQNCPETLRIIKEDGQTVNITQDPSVMQMDVGVTDREVGREDDHHRVGCGMEKNKNDGDDDDDDDGGGGGGDDDHDVRD